MSCKCSCRLNEKGAKPTTDDEVNDDDIFEEVAFNNDEKQFRSNLIYKFKQVKV